MIRIIEPDSGIHFVAPTKIDITFDFYDHDDIMSKAEYYIGSAKIRGRLKAPYSF